jgi:hypothetical protein
MTKLWRAFLMVRGDALLLRIVTTTPLLSGAASTLTFLSLIMSEY